MPQNTRVRLTRFTQKAGCASKFTPGYLERVLSGFAPADDDGFASGMESHDDAGYVAFGGGLLLQSVDFFTPIVDDPYRFGQVAAANALSDIYAMGGEPLTALNLVAFPCELDPEVLREILAGLDERDRHLAGMALFVGFLMDEFREEPQTGDFLVRNLIGVDPYHGALAVGENLQQGARVRFHLRDAATSAEDLHTLLQSYERGLPVDATPAGALLFSCLGRGQHLYGQPNFDTSVFREHLGDVPVGGFFCNGEIGPVGGSTFLHGYTSSFGLFRPRATY